MELIDHLIAEHRKVEEILGQLGLAGSDERGRLLDEVSQALAVHMDVEELEVYPLVAAHLGDDRAADAEREHALARDALEAATEASRTGDFQPALERLRLAIQEHVASEETGIFPVLRQRAAADLEALGTPDEVEADVEQELADQDAERP